MSAFNALTSCHWAIKPDNLKALAKIALRKNEGLDLEALSAQPGAPLRGTRLVTQRDGVAIVPVTGPLFPKASMLDTMCGAVSLETLMQDIKACIDSADIHTIVLDMDSPGGVAFGPSEMAAFISKAKEQKEIIAYVGGMSCSAAYWIASACTKIVAEKSAMLGSIGVVTAVPVQEVPDSEGNKYIEIVSSNAKNKRPDPLTEEGMKEITRELDALENLFVSDVANYRGVSTQVVMEKFGAGGVLIAADAVRVGMADQIGSFEDVLQEISNRFQSSRRVTPMTTSKTPAASASGEMKISLDVIKAEYPDIAKALSDEGFRAGADAERTRILAIEEAAMPGHEALIDAAKKDGKTTADQVALQIIKAEKSRGGKYLEALKDGSDKNPKIDPSANANAPKVDPAEDPAVPEEEKAKAKWDADKQLQAEFGGDYEAYVASLKAQASGRGRITARSRG